MNGAAPSRIAGAAEARGGRGGVRPTFGRLSLGEAEALLNGGLVGLNVYQLRRGVPGISVGLHNGQVRYGRSDPSEHWRSIREIWEAGGAPPPAVVAYREREGLGPLEAVSGEPDGVGQGDCEDLAAAVAAEWSVQGRPSSAGIQRIRPGLAHVVVVDDRSGRLADPSITGGMGRP